MATWIEIAEEYDRVTPDARCPCCGKEDWCLVAKDRTHVMCKRVASNSRTKLGYRHPIDVEKGEAFASLHTEVDKAVNKTNFDLLRRFCIKTLDKCRLESLSTELHVTELSLERLDLGYWRSKGCYMFPLKSPSDKTVGVLRRFNDGKKFLVKGSSIGLYLPTDFHWEPTYTMVAEGGSDTAALLDMGFNAVGRYNVDTCFDLLAELLPGHKVTIIMDNDKDGRGAAGAFALQTYLRSQFVESQILALPSQYKDIREMKRYLGGAKCLSWTLHSLKPLWS